MVPNYYGNKREKINKPNYQVLIRAIIGQFLFPNNLIDSACNNMEHAKGDAMCNAMIGNARQQPDEFIAFLAP